MAGYYYYIVPAEQRRGRGNLRCCRYASNICDLCSTEKPPLPVSIKHNFINIAVYDYSEVLYAGRLIERHVNMASITDSSKPSKNCAFSSRGFLSGIVESCTLDYSTPFEKCFWTTLNFASNPIWRPYIQYGRQNA